MPTPTTPADALRAAASLSAGAIKIAQEYKTRLAKLAKPVDPDLVEKAARALADHVIGDARYDQALQVLADPNEALKVLANLAGRPDAKAAADRKLAAGERVEAAGNPGDPSAFRDPWTGQTVYEIKKAAADTEGEADRRWTSRLLAWKQQMAEAV